MNDRETPVKPCRYCQSEIHPRARVCPECGCDQRPFWHHFDRINVLAAVVLLFLTWMQLMEAKKERVAAASALARAEEAKNESLRAERMTRETQTSIKDASIILSQLILFDNTWHGTFYSEEAAKMRTKWIGQKSKELLSALNATAIEKTHIYRYLMEFPEFLKKENANETMGFWNQMAGGAHHDLDIVITEGPDPEKQPKPAH